MRLFSTRAHGWIDYGYAAVLVGLPWLLGFARGGAETWVPVALGLWTLLYSLLTDHEVGVARRIQMPLHLWLDGLGGLLLAVSPWIFAFDGHVWIPHLVLGLVGIAMAVLTDTIPGYERRKADRPAHA